MKTFKVTALILWHEVCVNPAEVPVTQGLVGHGFISIVGLVKLGKCAIITLDAINEEGAKRLVTEMGKKLLANPVMESLQITTVEEVQEKPNDRQLPLQLAVTT